MFWELGQNFLLGGFLIALALAIGKLVGPFIAGIIAALPVRLGATLFLGGISNDVSFVLEMIKGAVPGSLGALCFMVVLSLTVKRVGVPKAFVLGCLACLAVVYIGYSVQVMA
jgi:hypothetical protein